MYHERTGGRERGETLFMLMLFSPPPPPSPSHAACVRFLCLYNGLGRPVETDDPTTVHGRRSGGERVTRQLFQATLKAWGKGGAEIFFPLSLRLMYMHAGKPLFLNSEPWGGAIRDSCAGGNKGGRPFKQTLRRFSSTPSALVVSSKMKRGRGRKKAPYFLRGGR